MQCIIIMKYSNFDRFHAHEVEGEAIKCSQLRHILIYYRYQHFPPWKEVFISLWNWSRDVRIMMKKKENTIQHKNMSKMQK